MVAETVIMIMNEGGISQKISDDKSDPVAYFVSFASFPLGSTETSGSRFGMIFNPWLGES